MEKHIIANAAAVCSDPQMAGALGDSVGTVSALLSVDTSIILLQANDAYVVAAWHGRDPGAITIRSDSALIHRLQTDSGVITLQLRECSVDGDLRAILDRTGLSTGLVVPLFVDDSIVGLWLVGTGDDRAFGSNEQLLLRAMAKNVGLLVKGTFDAARNGRLRREVTVLQEISVEILQLQDLEHVLQTIAEKVQSLLEVDVLSVALVDEATQAFRLPISRGMRSRWDPHRVYKNGAEILEGLEGRTLTPDDIPERSPTLRARLVKEGICSWFWLPLISRRGLVGLFFAGNREKTRFSHAQMRLGEAVSTLAAIAIENARLYEEQKAAVENLAAGRAAHERLLNLVLNNQGMQAIADALSELVRCPIVVDDSSLRILYWSVPEGTDGKVLASDKADGKLWHDPRWRTADLAIKTDQTVRLTWQPQSGPPCSRVVTPIVAGKSRFGHVNAVELQSPLTEQQYAILEQGSLIFALEFLKQEAARASFIDRAISTQEEERKRIARELHDETSQRLSALMVALDTAKLALSVDPRDTEERIAAARGIASGMLEHIHRVIADLRPSLLDDFGLVSAIAWLGEQRLDPLDILFRLECEDLAKRLSPQVETAIFRIVQEAITNVIRHARATTVTVRLAFTDQRLILTIADDGVGFDHDRWRSRGPNQKGLGLWGIAERAGILGAEFEVCTAPGRGTEIKICLPTEHMEVVNG